MHASRARFFLRHSAAARCAAVLGGVATAAAASSPSVAHASAPVPAHDGGQWSQHHNRTPMLSRYAAADAVERILPSVVKIQVRGTREAHPNRMFSMRGSGEVFRSVGSGFAIPSACGGQHAAVEIVTNHHVVGEALSASREMKVDIMVTTADGITWPAKVIASDERSDIALLRVEAKAFAIPPAELADSDAVRAGEFVLAVGAPLTLGNSCSFGVISSVRRDLSVEHGEDVTGQLYLQSDIALNHGNSGGPLCDLDGRVVGICNKKIEGFAEGIGFAIPANYAMRIIEDLRNHGKVIRPFLGLAVISLTRQVMDDIRSDPNYKMPKWLEKHADQSMGVPFSHGLIVHNITKRGPADVGGLKKGDVILSVDGVLTTTASQFLREMSFKVGRPVQVQYRAFSDGSVRVTKLTPEALDA